MFRFTALIFANGESRESGWIQSCLKTADFLIAADGGLRHLHALGTAPQLLIGDLDSAEPEQIEWAKQLGTQVKKFPAHKDETDLELALLEAVRMGASEITIAAGLGGRLDQTLANLSLLRLPELKSCTVRFEDGVEEVFLIREHAILNGRAGDVVSLIPLWGLVEGVTTINLDYPLAHEPLFPEHSRGVSNRIHLPPAEVSVASGDLLCIHTRVQN